MIKIINFPSKYLEYFKIGIENFPSIFFNLFFSFQAYRNFINNFCFSSEFLAIFSREIFSLKILQFIIAKTHEISQDSNKKISNELSQNSMKHRQNFPQNQSNSHKSLFRRLRSKFASYTKQSNQHLHAQNKYFMLFFAINFQQQFSPTKISRKSPFKFQPLKPFFSSILKLK